MARQGRETKVRHDAAKGPACAFVRSRAHRSAQSASRVLGLVAALAFCSTLASSACVRSGAGQGPASERQSDAEYDVARDLFWSRRDLRGALAHAQKAAELNDGNADAHHLVALLYLSFCATSSFDCRLADAERSARKALDVRNDFREARNTLGVVLIQEKRFDEAISILQPLANDILYTTPWDAWGNLGLAYFEKGRLDESIEALKRSVAAEPQFCVGYYRLGIAYEKKGQLVSARDALTRALETNRPECQALQDAFEARGRVFAKLKSCDLARGDWEHCKQLSAESPAGARCAASLTGAAC